MSKSLTEEQRTRLPKDGDYRNWVLYMASKNNGAFNFIDYKNEVASIANGELARLTTAIKELEDAGVLIKRSNGRIYDITNKGQERFNNGEFTKAPLEGGTIMPQDEKSQEKSNKNKDDLTLRKLNRTSDSIDEVERKVDTTSKLIAVASIVSAIAICVQVFIAITGTTTIDGEVHVFPKKEKIDSLEHVLKKSMKKEEHLSFQLDSLKKEFQKQIEILDSTSQELIKVQQENKK